MSKKEIENLFLYIEREARNGRADTGTTNSGYYRSK